MAKKAAATERKSRSTVDPNETPEDKFSRLASARVTKAVKAIDNLRGLSGRNYVKTDEQVSTILSYIDNAVAMVRAAFENPGAKATGPVIKI